MIVVRVECREIPGGLVLAYVQAKPDGLSCLDSVEGLLGEVPVGGLSVADVLFSHKVAGVGGEWERCWGALVGVPVHVQVAVAGCGCGVAGDPYAAGVQLRASGQGLGYGSAEFCRTTTDGCCGGGVAAPYGGGVFGAGDDALE